MKKGDTRDKIVQAAFRLFHKVGYNGTSIQDIIEAAGVPKGSSYNYFKSKEQLAAEILSLYTTTMQEAMMGSPESSPIARLRSWFEASISQHEKWGFKTGCMMGNFAAEISNSEEGLRTIIRQDFDFWNGAIAGLLTEAKQEGEIPADANPKELANYILNSYHGAILRGKVTRSRLPYDQFLHFTFDELLKSLPIT
jgi:TetR/AcrR family transcriptional repressor of nem operon